MIMVNIDAIMTSSVHDTTALVEKSILKSTEKYRSYSEK